MNGKRCLSRFTQHRRTATRRKDTCKYASTRVEKKKREKEGKKKNCAGSCVLHSCVAAAAGPFSSAGGVEKKEEDTKWEKKMRGGCLGKRGKWRKGAAASNYLLRPNFGPAPHASEATRRLCTQKRITQKNRLYAAPVTPQGTTRTWSLCECGPRRGMRFSERRVKISPDPGHPSFPFVYFKRRCGR